MSATSAGPRRPSRGPSSPAPRLRRWLTGALLVPALTAGPGIGTAEGQLTAPCRIRCGIVLGAASFSFATGTTTAVGRLNGGFSRTTPAIALWSTSFAVSLRAGLALHEDGSRQRRAIYAAGLGAVGGALLAFTAESLMGERSSASRWAATLVGAALGVAVGGAAGMLSHDEGPSASPALSISGPLLSLPLPR
ncbi:MAG: hypothetical protein R3304_02820 [Longimicrobiales bacterium]|nr:hypothetical protein [Longimicrobiales bacterium]